MSRKSLTDELLKKPRYARQIAPYLQDGQQPVQNSPAAPAPPQGEKARKHRNLPVDDHGERFDSRLEWRVCKRLRGQHGFAGIIRQVSMPIGLERIRPDFLIVHEIYEDGTFRAELADSKGHPTEAWKRRCRRLKRLHGLTVRQIKS